MKEGDFTLQQWAETEKVQFKIPEEVVDKLIELMDQFHTLAEANGVPFICHFVTSSDTDTFHMVSNAALIPIDRVPAELLIGYTACLRGSDAGLEAAMQIVMNS